MKAKIKINYSDFKKGEIFQVIEIKGSRITLEMKGRKVDFGFSEVNVIVQNDFDLFNLGRELLLMGKKPIQGWRDKDLNDFVSQIKLPINKTLIRKSINSVIWGN